MLGKLPKAPSVKHWTKYVHRRSRLTASPQRTIAWMVTIKKVAELTGVPEHTLRAWERRYGLVEPARSPSGYRLYDEAAIAAIRRMSQLVRSGWPPRRAAEEAARRIRVEADGARARDDLLAAAVRLDGETVERIVADRFAQDDFERVTDEWLMPALSALGRAWARGELTVAGEHLVAAVTMRRLAAAYDEAARFVAGPTVLVGAPPGVDHEIGLLAFATAARRAGLRTVYLGAQVPAPAWREAAAGTAARHAVTSLHRRADAVRLEPVAAALAGLPALALWVGGSHQSSAPVPFQPLGHSVAAAAATLATS